MKRIVITDVGGAEREISAEKNIDFLRDSVTMPDGEKLLGGWYDTFADFWISMACALMYNFRFVGPDKQVLAVCDIITCAHEDEDPERGTVTLREGWKLVYTHEGNDTIITFHKE